MRNITKGQNQITKIGSADHVAPFANAAADAISGASARKNRVTLFGLVVPLKILLIYEKCPKVLIPAHIKVKYWSILMFLE